MASKKFSDLSPQQQGILLACLPVLLAAFAYYDLVMPLGQKVKALEGQRAVLHSQNLRGRALEGQRADLIKRIALAQKQLDTLRQIVPDQSAEDQFVKLVHDTAASSAVRVRSLVEQPPIRQMYDTAMPFTLHLDGTYYGMLGFFSRLAASSRIVNISGLTLGPAAGQGGMGSYRVSPDETVGANCVLTTFYNSPPPPPPPPRRGLRR
ncbi:MAG: type 4a pilus biogenesis protein PilO [Terriglobia bacterium]